MEVQGEMCVWGCDVCVLAVCTLMLVSVYFQGGLCSGEAVCGVCVSLCYEQRYIPVWLCVWVCVCLSGMCKCVSTCLSPGSGAVKVWAPPAVLFWGPPSQRG